MASHEKPESPEQMRIVNAFLKHHPQVAEAIAIASTVISKVRFPINSFQDLTDAMGGAETAVQFGGRSFTLAELEDQVPCYYFPIANENDLIAKIGDLSKRMPSVKAPAPVLIPATASMRSVAPPTMSLEEMQKAPGFVARGVAAVGGIRR
jgi:hypothetical protein